MEAGRVIVSVVLVGLAVSWMIAYKSVVDIQP